MHRDYQNHDGGWLRRTLGKLTRDAIRKLSVVSRRLGYPALATVPVSAAMLTRLDVVTPQQPLEDVAQLFVGGRNSQLPVVEHGLPVSVVTRDDVARGLEIGGPRTPVSEAPQHHVLTVTPSDSLADVMEQLRLAPDSVAVVVDHGAPVGLLTFDGLVAYLRAEKPA
ncbi:MAG: CBS domain-containing protein [Myxococcota bacterium]|nr:CBS domain-containing protein [Myxococcota bacterium]